jgi:hypothetical protein
MIDRSPATLTLLSGSSNWQAHSVGGFFACDAKEAQAQARVPERARCADLLDEKGWLIMERQNAQLSTRCGEPPSAADAWAPLSLTEQREIDSRKGGV